MLCQYTVVLFVNDKAMFVNDNVDNHNVIKLFCYFRKSLDLHDCLLRLSEFGLYSEVRSLYDWPYSHCPDLLALALVQVQCC